MVVHFDDLSQLFWKIKKMESIWAWIFLSFGFVSFFGFLFAAIVSKLLPPFDNWVLSAIQSDGYYCLLVPLTVPVLVFAIYLHWLSMKLFKHA